MLIGWISLLPPSYDHHSLYGSSCSERMPKKITYLRDGIRLPSEIQSLVSTEGTLFHPWGFTNDCQRSVGYMTTELDLNIIFYLKKSRIKNSDLIQTATLLDWYLTLLQSRSQIRIDTSVDDSSEVPYHNGKYAIQQHRPQTEKQLL